MVAFIFLAHLQVHFLGNVLTFAPRCRTVVAPSSGRYDACNDRSQELRMSCYSPSPI